MATPKQSTTQLSRPVGDQEHVLGSPNAAVTLLEYGDFECPYSQEGTEIARTLFEAFQGRLRFVFRHFPLMKHPHAQQASEAAEAAAAQGKFWEMAEILFANQDRLTDRELTRHAGQIGLDLDRFKRDLSEHRYAETVRADVLSGTESRVTGTPTWFINSEPYDGPDDRETLHAVLQRHICNVEACDP
ncbi:MAG: thioredoxin domain-containing protein [Nitrospira sp. CR1.1]|nr:thioredoxin domain-containing protein [Nitrospira sp. CR1.1]